MMLLFRQQFRTIHSAKKLLQQSQNTAEGFFDSAQKFQTNDFETFYKNHHVETNPFQKLVLTVGSAAISLLNPSRGDMIACLGETTSYPASQYMLNKMEASKEGSEILNEKPRINSSTVNLDQLKQLPEGTLGKVYSDFLEHNQVTPDSRAPVQFVDDVKLAYVVQRYREVHDLVHAVLGMPTNMLGEVTVKWIEAIQTRQPMCIGGALFGPLRFKPKQREKYMKYYLPWAIKTGTQGSFLLNIYFEKRWEQSIDDLHKELNIKPLVLPASK